MLQQNQSTNDKAAKMIQDLENAGVIQDATTTKSEKSRGEKQTANDFEKSGEPKKVGLIQSEKNAVEFFKAFFTDEMPKVFSGKKTLREAQGVALAFIQGEKKALREVGAKESAAVFSLTFSSLFKAGTFPTLETIRDARGKVQSERKAAKIEREATAKRAKIEALAKEYGIPFEKAFAMFAAGVLKL